MQFVLVELIDLLFLCWFLSQTTISTAGCCILIGLVYVLDEGDVDDPQMFQFWKELGGKPDVISEAKEVTDDLEAELDSVNQLYRIMEDGSMQFLGNRLSFEMLDSGGCFCLDCLGEVFVWIGKGTSRDFRDLALTKTEELARNPPQTKLPSQGGQRPSFVEVYRCVEGGEIVWFTEKFPNWPDDATLGRTYHSRVVSSYVGQ